MTPKDNRSNKLTEVTLGDFITTVWGRRKLIVINAFVFGLLGFYIAFTTPREWTTSLSLMPEVNSSSTKLGGALGGFAAGITGLSLNDEEGIDPQIYPRVMRSTPFMLSLMEQRYYFSEFDLTIGIEEYLIKHKRKSTFSRLVGIPFNIITMIRGSGGMSALENEPSVYPKLSENQVKVIEELSKRISLSIDRKTGIVSISVEMQDPRVCAEIAAFCLDYLTTFITDYESGKERRKLVFIETQMKGKKEAFDDAQGRLADFKDRNVGLVTNESRKLLENLETEVTLAFNLYSTLQQKYEEARISLEESLPVFTVLEPIKIPTQRSAPDRIKILFIWVFIGFFISILIPFFRDFIKNTLGEKS